VVSSLGGGNTEDPANVDVATKAKTIYVTNYLWLAFQREGANKATFKIERLGADAVKKFIRKKKLKAWFKIDAELGARYSAAVYKANEEAKEPGAPPSELLNVVSDEATFANFLIPYMAQILEVPYIGRLDNPIDYEPGTEILYAEMAILERAIVIPGQSPVRLGMAWYRVTMTEQDKRTQ